MPKSSVASQVVTLEIRRTIQAPRPRVFEAWTAPKELAKWHAPGPMTVPHADVDLRAGGKYRIVMRAPDGEEHVVHGEYRQVDRPKKLIYTWSWERRIMDSLVTVEFHERGQRGEATEVVLRHDLPSVAERTRHEEGWIGCLDKLEHEASAPLAIDGYDPVSYSESPPAQGRADISTVWAGKTWRFVSDEHRQRFRSAPESYAPAFAGNCAFAMSIGKQVPGNPLVWCVSDGRRYLQQNGIARLLFRLIPGRARKAWQNWARLGGES